ncbi:PAS domain S-box protein [Halobaculum sp. P14]|uniref:PAS domain S-box protein n=1 Tax=Halobaculum sp. P14 TaxID=3421638 RepID=UPI003EBF1EC5
MVHGRESAPDGSERLHRRAFRETTDPAVIVDTEFVIVDVNEALCDLTGYGRDELLGSSPLRLVDDPAVYEEIVDALSAGESWAGDLESMTKDGRLVHTRGSAAPLDADGVVRGYVAVFSDMTRQRRYEESLRILNRVLRHNIRNDANVVLGHLERVASEVDEELPDAAGDAVESSLETAGSRVREMLHRARTTRRFSGILTGGDADSIRPVDLSSAVKEAVADVPATNASISVHGVDDELDVLADDMLGPALRAVVENAVEHNDKDAAKVTVTVDVNPGTVTLSIADNGPGIDQHRRDEVLGREERTQVEHGEGLSLFFVDRLMDVYGGDVDVRENDPEGTVFELRFRRPTAGADPYIDQAEAEAGSQAAESDAAATDDGGVRPADRGVDGDGAAENSDGSDAGGDAAAGTEADAVRRAWTRGRAAGADSGSGRSATGTGSGAEAADGDTRSGPPTDTPGEFGGRRVGHGTPETDRVAALAAAAVGDSVTRSRLAGQTRWLPSVVPALGADDQPHHLLRLRRSGPLVRDGETLLRGAAAAAFLDDAVLVATADARFEIAYQSLAAVGRVDDALLLDTESRSYRLQLPRNGAEAEYVDAAVAFLRDELRR